MKALLMLLCLFLVGCAVPTYEAPRFALWATIRTAGTSMGHENGQTVRAGFGFPYEKLKAGDTVLIWNASRRTYIHHRLVRYVPLVKAWVTQGDANKRPDAELLTRRNYVAKTISIDPVFP